MSGEVTINLVEAPPAVLRLLVAKVLLEDLKGRLATTDGLLEERDVQGLKAIQAMLEDAVRTQAPCAVQYALGAILGAAGTAELRRVASGLATAPMSMRKSVESACAACGAALAGETPLAATAEGAVH